MGEALKEVVEDVADLAAVLDYVPMSECGTPSTCRAEIREISQTDDVILVLVEPAGDDILVTAERSKAPDAELIVVRETLSGSATDYSLQLAQLVGRLFGLAGAPSVAAAPPPSAPPNSITEAPRSTADVEPPPKAEDSPLLWLWLVLGGLAVAGGVGAGAYVTLSNESPDWTVNVTW